MFQRFAAQTAQLFGKGGLESCPLWMIRLFPFLRWADRVNQHSLREDFVAGLTGAIVVLPQGVAFATIPA